MAHNDDFTSPPGTWTAPAPRTSSRGQTIAGGVAIMLLFDIAVKGEETEVQMFMVYFLII